MSQSVLVEKLTIFKELTKVSKHILERPKYTTIGKTRRQTARIPKIAEADLKYIAGVLFNSNPIYHMVFKTDTKDKLCGIVIESDFESSTKKIENTINRTFDMIVGVNRNQFEVLEMLTLIINESVSKSFNTFGVFSSKDELKQYIETFIPQLEECMKALETIENPNKKCMMRICKANLHLANVINSSTVKQNSQLAWEYK